MFPILIPCSRAVVICRFLFVIRGPNRTEWVTGRGFRTSSQTEVVATTTVETIIKITNVGKGHGAQAGSGI